MFLKINKSTDSGKIICANVNLALNIKHATAFCKPPIFLKYV